MKKINDIKRFSILFVLFILCKNIYSIEPPSIEWTAKLVIENYGWIDTVDETSDGGYISGGTIYKNNAYDVFLMKLNNIGEQEWIKYYADIGESVLARSVKQTPDGGYVFLFRKEVDENGHYTALVIKTNSLGDTEWRFSQPDLYSCPINLIINSQGGYIFCDYYGAYLISNDGVYENKFYIGVFLDNIYGNIKETKDGGFVSLSWSEYTAPYVDDVYYYTTIDKYDSNANKIWSNNYETKNSSRFFFEDLCEVSDGYILPGDDRYITKIDKYEELSSPWNDYLWNYNISNFEYERVSVSQDEKLVYINNEGNDILRVFKTEQHPPMEQVWSVEIPVTGMVSYRGKDIIPTSDAGYLIWMSVEENTENNEGVNKLIKLGPDPELTFAFEDNQQGWASGGAEGFFTLADASYTSDSLMLQAIDNNTYGYWESSRDLVPYVPNSLYKATLNVRGTVPQEIAPTFRCRMNAHNATVIGLLTVDSFLDGAESPANDDTGTTYTIFYDPLDQSGYQDNELTDDLFLGVEIVNLYNDNATTGGFCFDNVVIDRFDKSLMPTGDLVKTYDTTADFATWQLGGAPDFFTMPIGVASSDSLTLTSNNDNTNTYGYWETSRTANEVDIEPNKLYKAVFTVSSTTAQELSPYLRLRINTESNKMSYTYAIFSNHDGANSPTVAGKQYTAYLYPPQSDITQPENQNGLIFAIDLANIPIAVPDDPNGTLTLEKVEISTIDVGLLP